MLSLPKYVPQAIAYDNPSSDPILQYIVHPPGTHHGKCELTTDGWREIPASETALECRQLKRSLWFGVDDVYVNDEGRVVVHGGVQRRYGYDGWDIVPERHRGRGRVGRTRFLVNNRVAIVPHGRCANAGYCVENEDNHRIKPCR